MTKGAPARGGRPAQISRQKIAKAALDVGFENITIVNVAKQLGVDHSSLYRHISSREDILIEAVNLIIDELPYPEQFDAWRDFVFQFAKATWDIFQLHPGAARIVRDLAVTPPKSIATFAKATKELQKFGFSPSQAVLLLDSVLDMTVDAAIGWDRSNSQDSKVKNASERMLNAWLNEAEDAPEIRTQINAMTQAMIDPPEVWWEKKLNLILDGAERFKAKSFDGS